MIGKFPLTDPYPLRLPKSVRDKAKEIVKSERDKGKTVSEADVYRYAILFFFEQSSTELRRYGQEE